MESLTPTAAPLAAFGPAPADCLICVAGKNNIACDALRYLVGRFGAGRLVVVPNSDDPGRPTWQHSLHHTAKQLGVREVALEAVYGVENLLLLSLEYNALLRPARFATRRLFNIHFSYLPQYKGMYTSVWPVLNNEAYSGATLHYIDKGIDTGQIVAQQAFPIKPADTARDVYFSYLRTAYELLTANFDALLHDTQVSRPQPQVGSSYYSKATIDFSKPAELDFRATAYQVQTYVRAFSFYEYQLPVTQGQPVWRAELTDVPSAGKPGTVVSEDVLTLTVSTIDYDVRLHKDHTRALFAAVEANDLALVQHLAPLAHDLNLTNRQGWSPLMVAGYQHHTDVARELISRGANIHQANLNGTSVLMYAKDGAARTTDFSLLEHLLALGADAAYRDAAGLTVADYCRAKGQQELATFFEASLAPG